MIYPKTSSRLSIRALICSFTAACITSKKLGQAIGTASTPFREACLSMGGTPLGPGDLTFRPEISPRLSACLKFCFSGKDLPPRSTLLWDKNTLRFVRCETVCCIAGRLQRRLLAAYGRK